MTDSITHLKDLRPDPRNARKHTPRNVGSIVSALHEVGAARSIVIDEDGTVLAGNATIEAAAEAGITRVQVVDADGETVVAVRRSGLTPEQKTRLALFDNRAAELAEWDAEVLRGLADEGALAGLFSEDELAALLETGEPKAGLTDPDAVTAERGTDIIAGDMFSLGKHLLLCGDSTKAEDVARVMAGGPAQAIVTSPPYDVGMDYEGDPKQSDTVCLVTGVFSAWNSHIVDNGFAFINFGERYVWDVPMVQVYHDLFVNRLGWRWYDQRFWKRSSVGMAIWNTTQPRSMSQVEYLFTFQRGRSLYPVHDLSISKEQLWDDAGSSAGIDHPAVMAVGIAQKSITIYSDSADAVGEPFSGSGTTLIACEQLGRVCHAIEIEPRYVQVAIDRWEQFTGQKATKVGEAVRA